MKEYWVNVYERSEGQQWLSCPHKFKSLAIDSSVAMSKMEPRQKHVGCWHVKLKEKKPNIVATKGIAVMIQKIGRIRRDGTDWMMP